MRHHRDRCVPCVPCLHSPPHADCVCLSFLDVPSFSLAMSHPSMLAASSSSTPLESADGAKLFVGSLPSSCDAPVLRALFEPFGDIRDCIVLKNRHTHASRGRHRWERHSEQDAR